MQTAVAGVLLLAVSCGTLGCFIVLRRLSLLGDALGHAVLPGVCLGFLVTWTKDPWWIFAGAVSAALLASVLIAFIRRHTRLKADVAMGLVLSGFFGLGIVLLTRLQNFPAGSQSGLNQFLFGQASAIDERDLWLMGTVTFIIVGAVFAAYKELALTSFDEEFASAMGLPTRALHYLLMGLTALAIVIALQAVGVVLLSAMLIIPAATALFWTDRLHTMLAVSVLVAAIGGLLGLSSSYLGRDLPTGPFIVVTVAAIFAATWLFSPRYGVLMRALRIAGRRRRAARENLLKRLYSDLTGRTTPAALVELARNWNSSPAILRRQVRKLVRQGWADIQNDTVALTRQGEARARELVRNYQLWEQFLTDEVQLPSDHTERDAETIEHVLTPEMARALEERMQSSRARDRRGLSPPP